MRKLQIGSDILTSHAIVIEAFAELIADDETNSFRVFHRLQIKEKMHLVSSYAYLYITFRHV